MYRKRGDFGKAIRNLRAAAEEKRRGRDLPFLNWRYILFTHNDSDAEMAQAREMAADIGVDRLCWELTDHPEDMFSRRFVPGTPELAAIKREIWDDNNLGNAIPGATPRAQIDVRSGALRGLPGSIARRDGRPADRSAHHASATSRPAPFPRRRATDGAWCAWARSSATATARVINRDFERAWLPADAAARASRSKCR